MDFVKRYAVPLYFLLAFAISWGGVALVAGGPSGFPADAQQIKKLLPAVVLAMVAGPSLAGILMTMLVSGRDGLRALLSRFMTWRVSASWYAAALLMAPLTVLVVLFALTSASAHFLPTIFSADDKLGILLPGLAAGVVAGLFEELGWTGFAIPRLRLRFGIVATGLIVGSLWGLWHLIVALWGSGTPSGQLAPLMLGAQLVFYAGVLPAYRIFMVWVYDHTQSLLLSVLMHGALTAATTFVFAPPVTDEERIVYHLALSGAFWVCVAAIAYRGMLHTHLRTKKMASRNEAAVEQ